MSFRLPGVGNTYCQTQWGGTGSLQERLPLPLSLTHDFPPSIFMVNVSTLVNVFVLDIITFHKEGINLIKEGTMVRTWKILLHNYHN